MAGKVSYPQLAFVLLILLAASGTTVLFILWGLNTYAFPKEPYRITEGMPASHFYGSLHGGYSFDFPPAYEHFELSGAKEGNFFDRITNNMLFSIAMFSKGKGDNSDLLFVYFSSDNEAFTEAECQTKDIREAGNDTLSSPLYRLAGIREGRGDKYSKSASFMKNATAEYVKQNGLEICVITGKMADEDTKMEKEFTIAAGNCGAAYPFAAGGTDELAVRLLASTMKCGKDAAG